MRKVIMHRALRLCVFILCVWVAPLHAQELPADTLWLGEVDVKATRTAAIVPAQVLGGENLQRLNSRSVADALRFFSGVQIKDYGGVGGVKTVDMRSMGSNHMGVFYDGIQLGNAQNGQIDLGKFSLDNVDAIALYNGQKSEIFQPAKDFGNAGTLYITSRRPRFEPMKRYNVGVTFRTGSFGLVNPSARVEWRISEAVSMSASAEYTGANGRYKFRYHKKFSDGTLAWDTTATRHNGDLHSVRAEAGFYGSLPLGYWQGKAYFYDSERGIPGAIVNNVWKSSQRQWDRNWLVQGRLLQNFTEEYSLQVNAKYARDYMRYLNPDTTLMYINNRFWQDEVYLSAANKLKFSREWSVNIAADWQWNTLDATLAGFHRPTRNTLLGAVAASYSGRHLTGQASLLGTYVMDRVAARNRYSRRLTPAVFLNYSLPLGFEARAFFKQTFRMPTFNDLYYTDVGNVSLRPERATQYNLGLTWHREFPATIFSELELTADAYYNLVNDKIIAVPKGNGQYRWMMMNIGRVKIRGIDLTAQLTMEPIGGLFVKGRATYTFQHARDYSDPSDRGPMGTWKGQIAYIPIHSGSANVAVSYKAGELAYSFIYVGERWHNSANIRANYEQPWYTNDMSATWRFDVGERVKLRVTAELNNIFNQQYEVIQNYPMPGRNFKIILKCDI